MVLIEDSKFVLNSRQYEFINSVLDLPYKLVHATTNYDTFIHTLRDRPPSLTIPEDGTVVSEYCHTAESILTDFCKHHKIPLSNIFRSAINIYTNEKKPYGDIHTDHKFPYKSFIYYINDCDSGTYLFNNLDDDVPTCKINHKKDKAVIFDGVPHAAGFPPPGDKKIIFVATFN